MSKPRHTIRFVLTLILLAGIAGLVVLGRWLSEGDEPALQRGVWSLEKDPRARNKLIMGTPQFELTLVLAPEQADEYDAIIQDARGAARRVERDMNAYDPASPIGQFNAAEAGAVMPLPADTVRVLTDASIIWEASQQAFDVTIRPIIELWARCGKAGRLPTPAELKTAREASRWEYIEILDGAARKTVATAAVDLGGIAKGFGIDQAAEAMIARGAVGGLVNIGGDVRGFGQRPGDRPWRIGIRNPFDANQTAVWMVVAARDAAVCTSGNYERFSVIDGRHYSHIIDPRTAMPVDAAPSVTVIAPTATVADAWATALSVLGPPGLRLLEGTDIEAMIVLGTPEHYSFVRTAGYDRYVVATPPGWPAATPAATD